MNNEKKLCKPFEIITIIAYRGRAVLYQRLKKVYIFRVVFYFPSSIFLKLASSNDLNVCMYVQCLNFSVELGVIVLIEVV